ncbi:MAG: hypothetical protein CMO82_08585 [Winogradskyella sp.]|nr:hypothetical protein [Winogradskyella sp.]|tara:strand:- start:419 stop:1255 length:837 start_codon:yes stop_codon:yes gene_type:complete
MKARIKNFFSKTFGINPEKLTGELSDLEKLAQYGFENFGTFNDEDVFIIGYPKSGNTLLQHIVAHLVYGLRNDAPKSLINSCVTEFYNNPVFFRHDKRHFFKSHELPKKEFKKVIYIIRDGRESIRSYYYMRKNLNEKASLDEMYLSGGDSFVGTWNNHLAMWHKNPYNASILYLKYEDLIKDKTTEILKICNFLNLERSKEDIVKVFDATSFENMKKMENSYSWQVVRSYRTWKKEGSFVREGKTSGFKKDKAVNDSSLKQFVELSKQMLTHYGYLK